MNLYTINKYYQDIIDELEENGGELTPELDVSLQINESELEEQVESYIKAIRNLEAEAEAFKKEAQMMKQKSDRAAKTAERLKENILTTLRVRGIDKRQFGNFTAAVRRNERVIVQEDMLEQLPDDFKRVKTTIEADKTALKTALKAGATIEGVSIVDSYSLNIK